MKKVTPKKKRILIVGDSCRDIFVYCGAKRLAPDVPIPVLQVVSSGDNPGMAKNVARNVKAIYPHVDLVTNTNWRQVTKTRYMHDVSNQAFMRVDSADAIPRIKVRSLPLKKYDIIAVSDYDKGFLSSEDVQYICERHPLVFIDTKKILGDFLKDAAYIKINRHEYERSEPISPRLKNKIICTKGSSPVEYRGKQYPVDPVEVRDSSGAGDSFFAALLVRYAESGDIEESIRFANRCSTEVVQQRGVTIISRPSS